MGERFKGGGGNGGGLIFYMAKKQLEKAPEPKEIIHDAFLQFCADRHIECAEMAASLAEGVHTDTEEVLADIETFLAERGVNSDALLVEIAGKVEAVPRKQKAPSHMSVFESILLTREGVLKEGLEKPEHVAFAIARLAADGFRGCLLSLVGSAPSFEVAVERATALAFTTLKGFSEDPTAFLQEKLRDIPEDQPFLRKIYEKMFEELRRELEWREIAAENLAGVLDEGKIREIRIVQFSVEDWEGIPTHRSCLYQTLVKFWLPQAGVSTPEVLLAERGIMNPDVN